MEEVYFHHAMDWSVYSVHKIYGYRVKAFHLLVTERTHRRTDPKKSIPAKRGRNGQKVREGKW